MKNSIVLKVFPSIFHCFRVTEVLLGGRISFDIEFCTVCMRMSSRIEEYTVWSKIEEKRIN